MSKKSIVCHIVNTYLNLTENWIYEQMVQAKQFRVAVYALNTKNEDMYPLSFPIRVIEKKPRWLGLIISTVNKASQQTLGIYPSFLWFARKDKPSLFHAHFGTMGYKSIALKRICRIPLITTFYGHDLSLLVKQHPVWKKRYHKLFRYGDGFLVEGGHMKKTLENLGCPGKKIFIHHLGVNVMKIPFRKRILKNNVARLLMAASFTEKKGIPDAIEALHRFSERHPEKKWKLTIIGDSNGSKRMNEEKQRILSKIEKYNMRGNITMLGYQPLETLRNALYAHDIFLAPSKDASDGDTEGGAPVSLIEASASGMPIVASSHCDIPEIVLNGITGYIAEEKNIDSLIEKITAALLNPQDWPVLGEKGHKHMEQNYNSAIQIDQRERIYASLIQSLDV